MSISFRPPMRAFPIFLIRKINEEKGKLLTLIALIIGLLSLFELTASDNPIVDYFPALNGTLIKTIIILLIIPFLSVYIVSYLKNTSIQIVKDHLVFFDLVGTERHQISIPIVDIEGCSTKTDLWCKLFNLSHLSIYTSSSEQNVSTLLYCELNDIVEIKRLISTSSVVEPEESPLPKINVIYGLKSALLYKTSRLFLPGLSVFFGIQILLFKIVFSKEVESTSHLKADAELNLLLVSDQLYILLDRPLEILVAFLLFAFGLLSVMFVMKWLVIFPYHCLTTYYFDGKAIKLSYGCFARNHRDINLNKIISIKIYSPWYIKYIGGSAIEISIAGNETDPLIIPYISFVEIERLIQHAFSDEFTIKDVISTKAMPKVSSLLLTLVPAFFAWPLLLLLFLPIDTFSTTGYLHLYTVILSIFILYYVKITLTSFSTTRDKLMIARPIQWHPHIFIIKKSSIKNYRLFSLKKSSLVHVIAGNRMLMFMK